MPAGAVADPPGLFDQILSTDGLRNSTRITVPKRNARLVKLFLKKICAMYFAITQLVIHGNVA